MKKCRVHPTHWLISTQVTHLDVDKTDLVKAVRGLEADPSQASKLRKGAKSVEYAFTTPESLADYLKGPSRSSTSRKC